MTRTLLVDLSLASRLDTSVFVIHARSPTQEREVKLNLGDEVVLGSAPDASLHVDDDTTSRYHARLRHIGAGVRVTDLGSTNGVAMGEVMVQEVTVPPGTSMRLGRVVVTVRHDEQTLKEGPAREAFGDLIGADPRTQQLFGLLQEVAVSEATVVLEGETGTGKEVVAHGIHEASPRKAGPFVVFDCGAVPKDLVESQLFGHVKGAFTGASSDRLGAFRRANGGTLFIDEIAELPLELQPRLLRALESRTVQPVGSDDSQRVNVRVVCASHRALKDEVKQGRFREDLYFRIAVVRVRIPPLRERPKDLVVLAEHFARLWAKANGAPTPTLDKNGFAALAEHPFAGNVRELRNLIERALALAPQGSSVDLGRFLSANTEADRNTAMSTLVSSDEALQALEGRGDAVRAATVEALMGSRAFRDAKAIVVDAFERVFLSTIVERAEGNLSRAAVAAQMDRKHLRELLKRHDLYDGDQG